MEPCRSTSPTASWVLLDLSLHMVEGPTSGAGHTLAHAAPVVSGATFVATPSREQTAYVGRLLQRVLASAAPSASPLTLAYDVCHGFVARAALESL
jgi:hypothetical protein